MNEHLQAIEVWANHSALRQFAVEFEGSVTVRHLTDDGELVEILTKALHTY